MNKGQHIVAQFEGESSHHFGKTVLPGSVFVTTGPSNPLEALVHQQFIKMRPIPVQELKTCLLS